MSFVPENVIAEIRKQIDGQLIDRGRVVDHLLDLRIAADEPAFHETVDRLLVEIPGKNVVESTWFNEALDELLEASAPQPA